MTARSSPKDIRMPVGRERYHRLGRRRPTPQGEMLWALPRMANGDGSSGHRHDASPLQGRAALSIAIGQKTQMGKDCR